MPHKSEQSTQTSKKDEQIQNLQKRIIYLRSAQDSICELKRNFLKRENKIDAGLFRRLELYIRELVLACRCELLLLKSGNFFGSQGLFEMFFEQKVVEFYRKSSNHHTKFLPILNTTILMVVSYGLFLGGCDIAITHYKIYADSNFWTFYTPFIVFLTPFLIGNFISINKHKITNIALYALWVLCAAASF